MKKSEISQLTLRVNAEVITSLKLRSKQEKTSVNKLASTFIENELTKNENGKYFQLLAYPVMTLERIHKKISDSWNTGNIERLQSEEIMFIANGAIKRLENTHLAGSFYEGVRARAARLTVDSGRDEIQALYSFAVRHYLKGLDERMQFALNNAPDGINTKTYSLAVEGMTFKFVLAGNEMNKFVKQEEQRAPTLMMLFKSARFEIPFDWDTFSALARIMWAVNNSEPLDSRPGAEALLTPDRQNGGVWLLCLGNRTQIQIGDCELIELAEKFIDFLEGDARWSVQQLHLVYGE